jgi:hypothetical protein
MPRAPDPEDEQSGTERIGGIIALFFYALLFVEALGITLIVGLTDVAPRAAALVMLAPALLVWVMASTRRRFRSAALMLFPPVF